MQAQDPVLLQTLHPHEAGSPGATHLRRYGDAVTALVAGTCGGWLDAHLLASPVRPRWVSAPPQRFSDVEALQAVRSQARAVPHTHIEPTRPVPRRAGCC